MFGVGAKVGLAACLTSAQSYFAVAKFMIYFRVSALASMFTVVKN